MNLCEIASQRLSPSSTGVTSGRGAGSLLPSAHATQVRRGEMPVLDPCVHINTEYSSCHPRGAWGLLGSIGAISQRDEGGEKRPNSLRLVLLPIAAALAPCPCAATLPQFPLWIWFCSLSWSRWTAPEARLVLHLGPDSDQPQMLWARVQGTLQEAGERIICSQGKSP